MSGLPPSLPRPGAGAGGGSGFIFQIGFKRCGTTSIAAFLNRSGIPCVHHDRGRLARRMRDNLDAGRAPLDGYDRRWRAFTNMDFQEEDDRFDGFRHFEALDAAYGGRFVLNTRPMESWIASVMRTAGQRRVRRAHESRFGTSNPEQVAACWRAEREAHHAHVLSVLPPERLLVFDIEADPPERLCDFLGLPRECSRFWTRENPSPGRLGAIADDVLPAPVKRAVPDAVKRPLKRMLGRLPQDPAEPDGRNPRQGQALLDSAEQTGIRNPAAERAGARPAVDWLLAVGPGRSSTTFLHRRLMAHPGFVSPGIKEANLHRSPRRLARALRDGRARGATVIDVADTAWADPRLDAVSVTVRDGVRVLVIVMLRSHCDRARSLMAWRRSRVFPAIPALLAGPGGLERAAVRDALTPEALERVFRLGADVLVIEFGTLVAQPGRTLDALARLCGTEPFGEVDAAPVNRAEAARSVPLAAAAKLAAWTLRTIGARRTLQALKDNPRLVRTVFRPARPDEIPELGDAATAGLNRQEAECRAIVEARCEPLDDGLWLARAPAEGV